MNIINVSNNIIPIGEFKLKLAKWFTSVKTTNHPLIITQNGKPAGVLLSPVEYDELIYNKSFTDSINKGLDDIEQGNIYTTNELKNRLKILRNERF